MTGHRYARTPEQAKAIKQALRGFLFCPHCGATDVGCLLHQRSQSSFSLRCGACGLLYHVKRADLAASARQCAAQAEDPKEEQLYERVAALFEPYSTAGHTYPTVPPEDIEHIEAGQV